MLIGLPCSNRYAAHATGTYSPIPAVLIRSRRQFHRKVRLSIAYVMLQKLSQSTAALIYFIYYDIIRIIIAIFRHRHTSQFFISPRFIIFDYKKIFLIIMQERHVIADQSKRKTGLPLTACRDGARNKRDDIVSRIPAERCFSSFKKRDMHHVRLYHWLRWRHCFKS